MDLVTLGALAVIGLVVWLVVERSGELFCLSWRNGELRLVRGAIPPALKRDLADALTRMKVASATVRAKKEAQGARLTASGVDDFGEQRLRNIFQIYPVATLRAAPRPEANRFLRFFGFGALIWFFGRRDD
jgi:hypothetical protein